MAGGDPAPLLGVYYDRKRDRSVARLLHLHQPLLNKVNDLVPLHLGVLPGPPPRLALGAEISKQASQIPGDPCNVLTRSDVE